MVEKIKVKEEAQDFIDDAEVKETKPQFELAEVATQTAVVIKDNSTGVQLSEAQVLVLLLNNLIEIKRLLG